MGRAMPTPGLRPMLPADGPVLAAILAESVEGLTQDDYTEAQRAAWASRADDEAALAARLRAQLTLVATLQGSPVGFASLADNTRIDMLFVHPVAVGQGVAATLIDALEKLAAARGASALTVDASDTAHGFFLHRGYADQRRNSVAIGDEWLASTTMSKTLVTRTPGTGPVSDSPS
jgi:putative acetyltransferase